jgi:hypothetical protein
VVTDWNREQLQGQLDQMLGQDPPPNNSSPDGARS